MSSPLPFPTTCIKECVHLVKECGLTGVGESEDEDVVAAVGLKDLAPHR